MTRDGTGAARLSPRRRRPGSVGCWSLTLALLVATVRQPPLAGQPALPTLGAARFESRADSTGRPRRLANDSLDWAAARDRAARARGLRIVISLLDRQLWSIIGDDTLLTTSIAVASGSTLEYQGRRWTFTMPRGRRAVIAKDSLPVWIPPDWHYYEVAKLRGLIVRPLFEGQSVPLSDGGSLELRSGLAGVVRTDSTFEPLPVEDELIFDGVLFVPPVGSRNRQIAGELGAYRLDLGEGYLLHGTPHLESIGEAATHGCVRLSSDAIRWLYEMVPLGTAVYIY